jgi:hypothetical protein
MATLNLGRIKPVFRGAYAGGTAYVVDDIVTSGGETFICIQASTGNATSNATYWTKLAEKGLDGTNVATTLTTQGDILYRDGSGLQRLPIGTAGKALKVNSSANGFEYGTAGGVLACYYDNWNTQYSASGTTLQVIYTSANRTLASTSSKMLIEAHLSLGGQSYGGSVGLEFSTNDGTSWTSITTKDMADTDNNQLNGKAMIGVHLNLGTTGGDGFMAQDSFIHLHSPNSTQVRYRLVMASSQTNSYAIFNNRRGGGDWGGLSHISEMEIGV